jgi:hypothetical protein
MKAELILSGSLKSGGLKSIMISHIEIRKSPGHGVGGFIGSYLAKLEAQIRALVGNSSPRNDGRAGINANVSAIS